VAKRSSKGDGMVTKARGEKGVAFCIFLKKVTNLGFKKLEGNFRILSKFAQLHY